MAKLHKLWRLSPSKPELRQRLSQQLKISSLVVQVLINRGVTDERSAREFLYGGTENLGNPYLLKDMEKAVQRIMLAIDSKEKITVYGDYDVDGITASALLYTVLGRLGATVEYYIPDRQTEGYGLNHEVLERLYQSGTKLLLTVDCGISAVEEIASMAGRLDVIITDHHQPPEQLPAALAIINPKQPDCTYADKYLAGVGVAFKLCQALWQKKDGTDAAVLEYLDMVAIGTIADIVPLMGENRILVKLGLQTLANTANIGLQALITVCDLHNSKIDTGKVGFVIAPRLNAVGRIGRASTGVELLTVKDATMAKELAIHLDNENSARQIVEKEIQDIAETLMADVDLNTAKTLVLAGEDWHSGVIGIVASRLVEKYYRPVVMISVKDGIGKGSCRSIAGFDIYDALHKCADILIQFGGHRQAAGLSILPENIEKLRERLNQVAAETLTEEDYIPVLNIDSFVPLEEINTAFLEQLSCLAPHGMGNPSPVFACEELLIADLRSIGQGGRHLKLKIKRNQISSDVIAWNMGSWVNELQRNSCIDLAFLPEINEWQGQRSIQLKAHDVRQTVKKAMIEQSDHRCITIKDNRNTSDKLGEILQVIKLGEKVLIYVNSDKEAQALVQKLRNCLPEASQQVAGYYQESNHDRNIQVVDKFFEGAIKVVVIAKGVEDTLKLPDVQHVILYQLPFSKVVFQQQCKRANQADNPSTLHFLFGKEDIQSNQLIVRDMAPERLMVGQVYLVLKAASKLQPRIELTNEQIAKQCCSQYRIFFSENSVGTAVEILQELALLWWETIDSKRVITLAPTPAQKLDIEQSVTFRAGSVIREELNQVIIMVMNVPVNELVAGIG